MCLGIPMQVQALDGFNARCEARGVERTVSLFLVQHEDIVVGDYVLVHVGTAIQKIDPKGAAETWSLLDEVLAAEDARYGGPPPAPTPESSDA